MLVTCILRCLGRLLWFVKSRVSGTTHRDMSTWKPISKSPRAVTNRTAHIQNCRNSEPIGVHLMMILYSLWHEFSLPPTSNSLHVQVATSAISILHTTTSLWLTFRKQYVKVQPDLGELQDYCNLLCAMETAVMYFKVWSSPTCNHPSRRTLFASAGDWAVGKARSIMERVAGATSLAA